MDAFPRQLIAFANKVSLRLRAIEEEIRSLRNTLHKEAEANRKSNDAAVKKEPPQPTARDFLEFIEAVQTDNRQSQSKQQKYQRRTLYATWAGVIIVAAYTTFAAFQWCEMRKAAKAAEGANEIAHSALVATQRPWITVTWTLQSPSHAHSPLPSLTFNKDGSASFNAFVVVKNIGHSIATGIYIKPQMYPALFNQHGIFEEPISRQESWCDKVRSEIVDARKLPTLFPEEDATESKSLQMCKSDIEAALRSLPPNLASSKIISPIIYGCVNYRFSFSSDIHQTRFIYELTPVQVIEGTIPAPRLEILEFPFGGKSAD